MLVYFVCLCRKTRLLQNPVLWLYINWVWYSPV